MTKKKCKWKLIILITYLSLVNTRHGGEEPNCHRAISALSDIFKTEFSCRYSIMHCYTRYLSKITIYN